MNGTVLDTHFWGGAGNEIPHEVEVTGSEVYVVGDTSTNDAAYDLMLLRYQ